MRAKNPGRPCASSFDPAIETNYTGDEEREVLVRTDEEFCEKETNNLL